MFKDGVEIILDSNQTTNDTWDFYQTFDATKMAACNMVVHILTTNDNDKIKCGDPINVFCDTININVA